MGSAGTEYYVYDNGQLVVTIGAAAASNVSYVRGLNLIAAKDDSGLTYYHYNAHGDVVQTTDASGAVTHAYDYDAFGVERNADSGDTNPFRYCGEQFDAETGNYYLRARYYAPGVGRFTQEDTHWDPGNMVYGDDPLGIHTYTYKPAPTAVAQAGNLYVYGLNNPALLVDLDGESATVIAASIGGAITGEEAITAIEALIGISAVLEESKQWSQIELRCSVELSSLSEQIAVGAISAASVVAGAQINQAKGKTSGGGAARSGTGSGAAASGGPKRDDDDIDVTTVDPDNLPEGWTRTDNNDHTHIRDSKGRMRIRIDPEDGVTPYRHKHMYSPSGQLLDINGNPVPKKSEAGHIQYP